MCVVVVVVVNFIASCMKTIIAVKTVQVVARTAKNLGTRYIMLQLISDPIITIAAIIIILYLLRYIGFCSRLSDDIVLLVFM